MTAVPASNEDNSRLLAALALALVDQPRGTLQDLAKAVGISKATLYRFCRTRDELISRLIDHGVRVLAEVVQCAELDDPSPLDALRRLNANMIEQREVAAFLIYYWREVVSGVSSDWQTDWEGKLDAFFLRGQQQGVFRIDITAQALTEIWASVLIGLLDGERRGRIARAGLAGLAERAFLQGAGVAATAG
ncbi:TetR/AcrR family transcriptional regulator [Cupriavidus gilardii]|jgi:TetR/AcrR family transcriptional repressor of mexCD-oprJ operon|uniref:TetR/AcrR family transcriptional regulator n=1 Tax=Cupriavidus gilardii TaxID=82541 RepID=UPI00158059CC|nr:TetR/AcrR family transcriptional regulator [Cupriavidus gilardii]MCT9070211.1 TetR/AcrR family transcriptional regulator [Cupriavidus gilardii]QKS61375.1 TetR/AcrR family transcriptional regulator [Cupriavidus gilardii]